MIVSYYHSGVQNQGLISAEANVVSLKVEPNHEGQQDIHKYAAR